jgi:hypothetical protein
MSHKLLALEFCRKSVRWLALEGFRLAFQRKARFHACALQHVRAEMAATDRAMRKRWQECIASPTTQQLLLMKL